MTKKEIANKDNDRICMIVIEGHAPEKAHVLNLTVAGVWLRFLRNDFISVFNRDEVFVAE